MKNTGIAKIDTIIDAQSILLADGKIVHLLGFMYPQTLGDDDGDIEVNGKLFLEKILPKGTEVKIWQTADPQDRENRMGHSLAHLENRKTGEWANGAVIAHGLAWVMTDKSNADLSSNLYALEELARKNKSGLWAKNSAHHILDANDAAKGNGLFRIVEGRVTKASGAKNNVFINFGLDSRTDFTVMITPDIRKKLAKMGIDSLGLSGKKIRVRGWIRQWNGAFMELEAPERLEIL